MKGLLADLEHALRLYRRTPASSLISVAVLAIAMAVVTAFISLYVDLVLRPHPGFEQSNRIATIGLSDGSNLFGMPYEFIDRLADQMASIEAAAASDSASTIVGLEREEAITEMVSAEFFSGLRPRLALGRGFRTDDHAADAEPVVVLSHRYWQQQFDGDPGILGTSLEISRNPSAPYRGPPGSFLSQAEPEQETARFRIVGVLAETLADFAFSEPTTWVPIERAWPMFSGVSESLPPAYLGAAYVRRAPDASVAAVASELSAHYAGPDALPDRIPGTRLDVIGGIVRNIDVQRDAERQLELLLAGSVMLMLVAAANVSLFLIARAPGRRREFGIRMSVGAPINRLVRQLASEAGLLVVVSVGLGLVGSIWLSLYLRSLALLRDAEWSDVTLLDWRVLALAGVIFLVLTLVVSVAPILRIKRLGIASSSHQVAARASVAQRLTGTAQIAIAGTLGGAAIAFGWHTGVLMFGDPGYETADRYRVRFDGGGIRTGMTLEGYIVELARRREVIEAIPGVMAVGFGSPVPGEDQTSRSRFRIADPNDSDNFVEGLLGMLDSSFVDVLGLRLAFGRVPSNDDAGSFGDSVAVVNQTFARRLWGREDVVGERLPDRPGNYWSGAEIIGVIEDLSFGHPSAAVDPYIFQSLHSRIGTTAVIQTRMTAADLQQELERIESEGALETNVSDVQPLTELRYRSIAADRVRGFLAISAAALVVFLAAFGFYGTQRYLVAAGRREYAIRASLGAGPRALGRLVFGRGLLLGTPGLIVGGLLAFIVVAWLRDDFVSRNISPGVVTIFVVAGLVALLLLASLAPAHQARRTQPAPLLRED